MNDSQIRWRGTALLGDVQLNRVGSLVLSVTRDPSSDVDTSNMLSGELAFDTLGNLLLKHPITGTTITVIDKDGILGTSLSSGMTIIVDQIDPGNNVNRGKLLSVAVGSDDIVYETPVNLINRTAASSVTINTGTDNNSLITPIGLAGSKYNLSKATSAEIIAGSNDTHFVTPLGLAGSDGIQGAPFRSKFINSAAYNFPPGAVALNTTLLDTDALVSGGTLGGFGSLNFDAGVLTAGTIIKVTGYIVHDAVNGQYYKYACGFGSTAGDLVESVTVASSDLNYYQGFETTITILTAGVSGSWRAIQRYTPKQGGSGDITYTVLKTGGTINTTIANNVRVLIRSADGAETYPQNKIEFLQVDAAYR